MGQAFHIENFGCRAARADGEAVGDRLRADGFSEGQQAEANVVVVNTCSVTAEADRAARAYIRRTHRLNPEARIVVTGCYAQRAPEELAGMAGVAAVIGNSHKALAPEIIGQIAGSGFVPVQALAGASSAIWADDRFAHSFLEEAQLIPGEQTRPNLKIQEGCGNRCTFCVIPETRGPSRSLSAAAILSQVLGFVAAGGNELVLSGINLGRWGKDLPVETDAPLFPTQGAKVRLGWGTPGSLPGNVESEAVLLPTLATKTNTSRGWGTNISDESRKWSLAGLVRMLLETTGLPRLRLSSIEPMDWDADLVGLMREFGGTRLARHAHLPLQSGSDGVLRRMYRRYRPWHYEEKVAALVEAAGPELTLGADVMAGFPGETDAEFQETIDLIRKLPFGYLHLFPFSPRPNTRGWELHKAAPVPAKVVDERMAELRRLAAEKTRAHRERFVGAELEAITLHTTAELKATGASTAMTENFLPAEVADDLPANRLVRLQVVGLTAEGALQTKIA